MSNISDKEQTEIEDAAFDGGIPVFEDGKTNVIVKVNGAAERDYAGVVIPASDKPSRFEENLIGKS